MTAANNALEDSGRRKRRLIAVVGAGLACLLLLHYWIFFALSDADDGWADLIQLRMKTSPLSAASVEGLVRDKWAGAETGGGKESLPLYTAWTEIEGVKIENRELGREASADVIYYCGDNNLRFDLVQEGGCALPAELAYILWKTQEEGDAVGREVRIGGRDFVVEKILPSGSWMEKWSGGAIIVRVNADMAGSVLFDAMDVALPGPADSHEGSATVKSMPFSVDELIMTEGLNTSAVIYFNELLDALSAMRVLPVWIVCLYPALLLFRRARKNYKYLMERGKEYEASETELDRMKTETLEMLKRVVPFAALAVGLIFLTAAVFGSPFSIPDSFLPTRWSDFSFWTSTIEGVKQEAGEFLTMELYGPDVWFRSLALKVITGCLGQSICTLLILNFLRRQGTGVL